MTRRLCRSCIRDLRLRSDGYSTEVGYCPRCWHLKWLYRVQEDASRQHREPERKGKI